MAPAIATIAADQPHRRRLDRNGHDETALTTCWKSKPKPSPRVAPAIEQPSLKVEGRVIAVISDYDELWSAVRARCDSMRLTREVVNDMADLQSGYLGKILGGAQVKKFGRLSLGRTLGAIGCDLALIEDEIQTAKIRVIDKIIAGAAAALGISRAELARLAGFTAVGQAKVGMSEIDDALASAGCKLALVEDAAATAKVMERAETRRRPLRPAAMEPR